MTSEPFLPIDLGHPDANRVINLARARLDRNPPRWYYLSFVDTAAAAATPPEQRQPGGPAWLGACYVDAPNSVMAAARAHELGCNPGGEVQIWGPLPQEAMDEHVPEANRRRLLSREDVL